MSPLSGISGQDGACLAVVLAAVNPAVGGVLLAGPHGTAKSTIVRRLKGLLPTGTPFVTVPLHAGEEALLGGIDLECTVKAGRRVLQPGLLARAKGGALLIDDLHLFPRDLSVLVAGAEGVLLVGTANPAEGEMSPHLLDRFGLAAPMVELCHPAERKAVLMAVQKGADPAADAVLASRIAEARTRMKSLPRFSERVREHIALLVDEAHCAGHRGELFLAEAARAVAAWEGVSVVSTAHVDRVAPLVLEHRRRDAEDRPPKAGAQEPDQPDQPQQSQGQRPHNDSAGQGESAPSGSAPDNDGESSPNESVREEVMAVGETFSVRRIALPKDRIRRRCSGRRSRSHAKGPDGRTVRTVPDGERADIALVASLRAAAPFQSLRGRTDRVLLESSDLRYRRRERRMGHLVLFLVDGSGSMGAARRMVAVKGAVQSLLLDCYQKRDRVALVVFRKDRAELALAPTRSVELASRCLATLAVGGKTPLAAGLVEAGRVAERARMKEPDTRVLLVVLSDGRANQALSDGKPMDEARRAARILARMPGVDALVVDTEDKRSFHRTDLAQGLATDLGATYSTLAGLAAPDLAALVRQARETISTR